MHFKKVSFTYKNAKGEIADRTVENIQATSNYFAGFCLRSAEHRTFRYDGIVGDVRTGSGFFSGLMTVDAWRKAMGFTCAIIPKRSHGASKAQLKIEVCFTGFGEKRGNALKAIAKKNNMLVRSKVTMALNYLVCGWNAGPKKREMAQQVEGCIAINEVEFLEMVETGLLPK